MLENLNEGQSRENIGADNESNSEDVQYINFFTNRSNENFNFIDGMNQTYNDESDPDSDDERFRAMILSVQNETTNFVDPYSNLRKVIGDDEEISLNLTVRKSDLLSMGLNFGLAYNLPHSGLADCYKMINTILQTKIVPETRYQVDVIF